MQISLLSISMFLLFNQSLFCDYFPPIEKIKIYREKILEIEDLDKYINVINNKKSSQVDILNSALQILIIRKYNNGNENLYTSIKRFQKCNCLKETGELNNETIKQLSLTKDNILKKIDISIKKIKEIDLPKEKFLLINIAGYTLSGFEYFNGKYIKSYNEKAVVGSNKRKTPLLKPCDIGRIVVNPIWYLPPTIVKEDIFPLLKKSPYEFKRLGYIVINRKRNKPIKSVEAMDWYRYTKKSFHKRFKVEQHPGTNNYLGSVKIIVKNNSYIIIHGTNDKKHFSLNSRPYSSGCIRLKNPENLAKWLLKNSKSKIEKLFKTLKKPHLTKGIDLNKKIKIHFSYIPVWINNDGYMCISDDPYKFFSKNKKTLTNF